jgi:hypothetical protein
MVVADPDEALIEAIAEACGVTLSPDELTRFWSKVEKTSTCWLWTAGTCRGYGYFATARKNGRHGRSLRAHRVAFELLRGPIPNGMQLDHLCRVRGCVNPDHLEVVTGATNTLRGISSPAINARKTHCRRGHEFTPENTYIDCGSRRCKACRRLIQNRWNAQQRAKEVDHGSE